MPNLPSSWQTRKRIDKAAGPKAAKVYPGVIENNVDPFRLQRLQVRVLQFHMDYKTNPTKNLPWAFREDLVNLGPDAGQEIPMPVGCQVWVRFINDDPNKPVVVSSRRLIPNQPRVYGQVRAGLMPIELSHSSSGPYRAAVTSLNATSIVRSQPETIREVRQDAYPDPTLYIPLKTPKGATILAQDRDGQERMAIIDRAGQGLFFDGPIKKEKNRLNATQRGVRSVQNGQQYHYSKDTAHRESSMLLADLAQQGLKAVAKDGEERLLLQSKAAMNDEDGLTSFEQGGRIQLIELSAGRNQTVFVGMKNGSILFKLLLDANRGIIDLDSSFAVRVKTPRYVVESDEIIFRGEVFIDGNVDATGDISTLGSVDAAEKPQERPLNYS